LPEELAETFATKAASGRPSLFLAMFGERQPSELSLSDAELAVHRSSEAGEDVEAFDFALLETHPA